MLRCEVIQYHSMTVWHGVCVAVVCTGMLCAGCHTERAPGNTNGTTTTPATINQTPGGSGAVRASAYDRIQDAAAHGQLSRKDAVLITARCLFAPHTLPPDSPFAPAPGDAPARDMCGTGFYKAVHQVYNELTDEERAWLASLNEDLRVIMAQKQRERAVP